MSCHLWFLLLFFMVFIERHKVAHAAHRSECSLTLHACFAAANAKSIPFVVS